MIERDHPAHAYQQLADDLRDRVLIGDLSMDRRLPSQPVLADEYKVSVHTVRRAIRLLQDEGVVTVVHALGMFGPVKEDRGRGG